MPHSAHDAQRLIRIPVSIKRFVLKRPSLPLHSLLATHFTSLSMTNWAEWYPVPTKGPIAAVAAIIYNLCGSERVGFEWAPCLLVWDRNLAGGLKGILLVRVARKVISES
jgi:hypothetical protein